MHERRQLNPSSCLTSASNAAEPVLSSHWESVAQAQRARAAAENALVATIPTSSLRLSPPTLAIIPPCINSDADDAHLIPRSLPITPTTSQAGSIPPSTNLPSELESDKPKSKPLRKRQCNNSR